MEQGYMSFDDTLKYMYQLLPMYQQIGKAALKIDLTNTLKLCEFLGDPHKKIKAVHIAGTNGKGSSAHMIAAIMQSAGYTTGLYTSPHLKRFTERIKVNGAEVDEAYVVRFIHQIKDLIEEIKPSFFEVTVAMAFDYFVKKNVDIAVVEVGLGGRLDSTNVITPLVSLITNIGMDHTDILGDTLPVIAFEKAGIIKRSVPVVVSEYQEETIPVFTSRARELNAPLMIASETYSCAYTGMEKHRLKVLVHNKNDHSEASFLLDLSGLYQLKNLPGVLQTMDVLKEKGYKIEYADLRSGLSNTTVLSGFKGRWQKLKDNPLTYCDTVHNVDGVREFIRQLTVFEYEDLYILWGAVEGKSPEKIFKYLPNDAIYYFCEANIQRSMKAEKLSAIAHQQGLKGEVVKDVNKALDIVWKKATKNDLVIVAGSNFLIAELEIL